MVAGELVRWRNGRGYLGDDVAVWDVCRDGMVVFWACFVAADGQNTATMDDCFGAGFWRECWAVAR